MNLSAFKAYDIRGEYPKEINEDLAYRVGRAFGVYLAARNVVVGMDMRKSSEPLKEKIIEGLLCEGVDVIDVGMVTTPMLNFAVTKYQYDGGIMVSASHSPGSENGFKLIDSLGVQIGEGFGLSEIKSIVKKGFVACPGQGAVTQKEILSDYLAFLIEKSKDISGLKVVVDYSNGVGSISGRPFFARLNDIESFEMNIEPDDSFPSHPANPHDIQNLTQLQSEVKDNNADIGLFFDGDADRVQIVDEKGEIVPMDLLFCLLAEKELNEEENKNKEYYFDLRFSKSVPEIIKSLGGIPVMMRVGNPFYKKALVHSGVMAAEFSGHVMYAEHNNIDDGLFCAIKVLNLLSSANKPLSKLVSRVKKYETSNEVSLKALNPETVFKRVKAEFPEGEEIEIDGLYLGLPDGFISVRRSQTETQLFRVRVEAKDKKEMEKRLHKVIEVVKS